jgi:hypothetical protein
MNLTQPHKHYLDRENRHYQVGRRYRSSGRFNSTLQVRQVWLTHDFNDPLESCLKPEKIRSPKRALQNRLPLANIAAASAVVSSAAISERAVARGGTRLL